MDAILFNSGSCRLKSQIYSEERKLLYAGVDLIRNEDYKYELMELELIEPSLYFHTNRRAAYNFA